MKNTMVLVEVYDNNNKLCKRRITDDFSKVEDWITANAKKWSGYDSLDISFDDYGCGEVVFRYSDSEYVQLFKIKSTNIGTI